VLIFLGIIMAAVALFGVGCVMLGLLGDLQKRWWWTQR
jgi:hypothetical protein